MMASAQAVETSVNTNNSPSKDYTTNQDDHSNHNIDSPGFKPFTAIYNQVVWNCSLTGHVAVFDHAKSGRFQFSYQVSIFNQHGPLSFFFVQV